MELLSTLLVEMLKIEFCPNLQMGSGQLVFLGVIVGIVKDAMLVLGLPGMGSHVYGFLKDVPLDVISVMVWLNIQMEKDFVMEQYNQRLMILYLEQLTGKTKQVV